MKVFSLTQHDDGRVTAELATYDPDGARTGNVDYGVVTGLPAAAHQFFPPEPPIEEAPPTIALTQIRSTPGDSNVSVSKKKVRVTIPKKGRKGKR